MKIKRFAALLLSLTLALSLFQLPVAAADEEAEPPAAWAAEQMADLLDAGVLGAQPNAHPSRSITRGYFCFLMVQIIQREGLPGLLSAVPPMPVDYFSDVVSQEGYRGRWLVYDGAAYGLTDGTVENGQRVFNCDKSLTREEAAKMVCSLIDALERYMGPLSLEAGTPAAFADAANISPWAVEWVNRASALGILKGDNQGRFNPKRTLSIQEAYVMLDRVFRAAEEARVRKDQELGIQSLKSVVDLPADGCLTGYVGHTTYLLVQNGLYSVLQIRDHNWETSCAWLETFDANGVSTGAREIPMELEYCFAFYEGPNAYYLLFGQENEEKDDSKEVYRLVRYDKSWNRQGSASLYGRETYTTVPGDFSSHTSMAEENGLLILHTSRKRYDGHQSNLTVNISVPDMTVLSTNEQSHDHTVSHSFAQYVMFDNGLPVYADHGDAYPRGFTLNVENAQGSSTEMNFFPFSGRIGDNNTFATPGGLGISADNYLFAGSSSAQTGNDDLLYRNAFLAVIPKAGYPNSTPQIKWLTSFPADKQEYVPAVQLVQMNSNTFVVMWQSQKQGPRTTLGDVGEFRYAVFDGQGNQVGQTVTVENYAVPKNDPVVIGNRILWVRTEMGPYGAFDNSRSRYLKVYELEIPLN